jgi:hypothetical protein
MNAQFGLTALAVFAMGSVAQQLPGLPEENGLVPKTDTIYVNRLTADIQNINNGSTESLGVAIANGGNVIVGWEDDGDGLKDIEAVWTLFDSGGAWITPDTTVNSVALGGSVDSKFLSFFRADKSAVYGGATWGPKIKANLFGDGIGMGSTSFGLSAEIASFAPYDDGNKGDVPAVQLLDNTGQPVAPVLGGVSAAYAVSNDGNIRIADWDYLSNGNLLVVGESRQNDDLINLYGGEVGATHTIFRIVDASGNVVKAETLASQVPVESTAWHGSGVTKDGFAIRFSTPSGVMVRLFDNSGNPTSTNINLAEATGKGLAGAGGRGDSAGFHGNGKDAYVIATAGTDPDDGAYKAWVTVLAANGTVRYSKSVADDLELTKGANDGVDAAIDADGKVVVVFTAKYDAAGVAAMIMGRRFDATGKAVGGTFYVSEKESPDLLTAAADGPRVAWRGGQVVVAWRTLNDTESLNPETLEVLPVVAIRQFSTFAVGSLESAGLTRLVADTPVVKTTVNALGNWEPYTSVLGTSTFLVECNTFVEDGTDTNQRYVVGLQPAAGGAMKLAEGFYADAGQPFKDQINFSRQNGNPGRVAGDTRPGAVNYMVGGEASPHLVAAFQTGNRWNTGFDRLSDGRYGTVQGYSLDTTALVPSPLGKAQDSANGRLTEGAAAGNQITRFGGDIVALDNGNFASVVEDRSRTRVPESDCVAATIFAPDGSVVKDTFVVANGDIWAGVAPFKGGFAVRCKPEDGSATRLIYFFDNAGTLKGSVDQAASGASFDTGRGDGTRLFGHINSPYVFLTGRPANTQLVKVAAFDSRTQKFVAVADVNEGAFTGNFDRAHGAVDALNRLTVCWVSKPAGYTKEQVAARVLKFDDAAAKFTPLTPSFFAFVNNATNDIRSLGMTVAMTTKQICVAAKGEINYGNKPELGPDSPTEVNFFTVFTHPNPADDPTTPVSGGTAPKMTFTRNGSNLVIGWDASATGFTLQTTASLSAPNWTAAGTQNPTTVAIGTGSQFYRLRK